MVLTTIIFYLVFRHYDRPATKDEEESMNAAAALGDAKGLPSSNVVSESASEVNLQQKVPTEVAVVAKNAVCEAASTDAQKQPGVHAKNVE
jgi:hypothetical protein